jgi:putative lipoprotein
MKRLSLIVLSALIAACSSMQPPAKATLEGEAFYLQRIALPPSAVLTVSLQDVSLADAPAVALARQSGPITGQVPLPFKLEYDPVQVKPGHRYSVSARVEADGHLLFISTQHHGVTLDGKDEQPMRIRMDPASH